MYAVTVTVPTTDVVVIVEDEERLIVVDFGLRIIDSLAKKVGIEFVGKADLHVHGKLELVVRCSAIPLVELLHIRQVCLADQNTIARILINHCTETPHDIMHLWQIVI